MPRPVFASVPTPTPIRKVLIITGGFNLYSVRKGIVELVRNFPQTEWMILESAPQKSIRVLLRNQWRNLRKNGWRWIPYRTWDLIARPSLGWRPRTSPSGTPPGAQYSAGAVLRLPNAIYHRVPDVHSEDALARVRAFGPDLAVSLAAPILRAALFEIPRLGTLNLHKGKLPDYRGMPPAFWEFVNGEPEVGCTIHRIDSGLDTGPILVERSLPRSRYSTVRGMQLALDELGVQLTCESLRVLREGTAVWKTQNAGGRTHSKPTLGQVAAMRKRLSTDRGQQIKRACKEAFFWCYVRLARPLASRYLAWCNRQRVVVLLYHRVSDDLRDSLTVGIEQFDAQMEWLRRHHQVVSIADIIHGNVPRNTARPVVAVTFDDGYLDNYEHAVPILLRHQVPAAFFVSTGMIGTSEGFPHDLKRLGKSLPTMTWEHLRSMRDLGFVIGSHTVTHLDCGSSDIDTVRHELIESRDVLRKNLGLGEVFFAYPFGGRSNMTPPVLRMVKELGYAGCLSAYGGFVRGPIDSYNVVRTGIAANHTLLAFRAALEGFYSGDRDHETAASQPPLIAHVIHHLVIGGLENGLVNLINRIPSHRYRHAIVCMTDSSDFSMRIRRDDVQIFAMNKKLGQDIAVYGRLYELFRRIRPDVIHSRNLTAMDSLLPAMLSGVRVRIHGEHGRDEFDTEGKNRKYRWLRRLHRPMISQYVALSKDLEGYLHEAIGVPQERITQIYNGVDIDLFHPSADGRQAIGPYSDPRYFVVGTVGRLEPVKDQVTLVRAMIEIWRSNESAREWLRLALVGDGALRAEIEELLKRENATDLAWLAGARDDVPRLMRGLDLFVLPSLAEGVSNTLLEAMASGLPVVATRVGGNPELVEEGKSGMLVPRADPHAMAAAIREYYLNRDTARRQGTLARDIAKRRFGLDVMVNNYLNLYDGLCRGNRHPSASPGVGKDVAGAGKPPMLPLDSEGQRKGR